MKDYYPEECKYFLGEISSIYRLGEDVYSSDGKAVAAIHIGNIYKKIDDLFREKKVEPNSSLGKSMQYWINHKEGLTRFFIFSLHTSLITSLV